MLDLSCGVKSDGDEAEERGEVRAEGGDESKKDASSIIP